ncbi:MAG: DUF5115 domain-containing protein [Candidatus Azobacteroides sp.]|nr:DUF5115 domain-containing protein [Candidatus Azobacteroides sp.]
MKKIILPLLSVLFLGAACSDDVDVNVAPPQTNPEEPAITIAFEAKNAETAYDMADIQTDSVAIADISSLNIMDGASVAYEILVSKPGDASVDKLLYSVSSNGNLLYLPTDSLRTATETFYGKRPVARDLSFVVNASVTSADQTFQMRSDTVKISVTLTAPVIESAYYLIGNVNNWDLDSLDDYKFSHSDQDVYDDPIFTIKVYMSGADKYFKIIPQSSKDKSGDDRWTGALGCVVDGSTDLAGKLVIDNAGAMRVLDDQWVQITLNMMDYTYTIDLLGETPPVIYMIGDDFGSWNWTSNGVVEMTPVNGFAGHFWAVRYISAGKGFKWSPIRDWGSDFYSLGEDSGYTVSNGNAYVAESGMYMVYVDWEHGKISVEPAKVYGMGDCFGGWNVATYPFAVEGQTMTYTTTGSGELRMYAVSDIAPVGGDWWRMEFIILDGKIVYRGNGDDQTRVQVAAGKKVTLDFNAGIGTIQ